jgi:AcrR family transcriptional regulator
VSAPAAARPGGRTARNTKAVFAATIGELSERSYAGVSIESIATRAGVHKTTIYRRWGTKDELIAQAMAAGARTMIEVPDTGQVASDLLALARSVQAVLASPQGAAVTRTLLAGAAAAPEIRRLMQQFWAARLAAISVITDRAAARGEIPVGTVAQQLMHALAAPLYYKLLVTGETLTRHDADLAAAAALAGAQAGAFTTTTADSPP